MALTIRKATKQTQKLRLLLSGPSGSGKTWSALVLARALSKGKPALVIDTERQSSELYADFFNFDVLPLDPPYSVERYIEALKLAQTEGYEVIIVDSLSHAWFAEGGVLSVVDNVAKTSRTPFSGWEVGTPKHNAFIDALLATKAHLICTARTKTAYEIQENDRGKKMPVKIGLAMIQRAGIEFEFTLVLDMAIEGHLCTASKDRTHLFSVDVPFVITDQVGQDLRAWLETGVDPIDLYVELVKEIRECEDPKQWWKSMRSKIAMLSLDLKDMLTQEAKARKEQLEARTQGEPGIPVGTEVSEVPEETDQHEVHE